MSYLPTSGSCCAPCAKSGGTCTGLGATKAVTRTLVNREIGVMTLAAGQGTASQQVQGSVTSHKRLVIGILAGTAALGALYLARRKR